MIRWSLDVQVQHAAGTVTVDSWVKMRCPARVAALLRMLRERLAMLLADKVHNPEMDMWTAGREVVATITHLVSAEKGLTVGR